MRHSWWTDVLLGTKAFFLSWFPSHPFFSSRILERMLTTTSPNFPEQLSRGSQHGRCPRLFLDQQQWSVISCSLSLCGATSTDLAVALRAFTRIRPASVVSTEWRPGTRNRFFTKHLEEHLRHVLLIPRGQCRFDGRGSGSCGLAESCLGEICSAMDTRTKATDWFVQGACGRRNAPGYA